LLAPESGALTDGLCAGVATLQAEGKMVVIVLHNDVRQRLIPLRNEPLVDAADAVAQLRGLKLRGRVGEIRSLN